MSRLRVTTGGADLAGGFELGFVDPDGFERREPLASAVEVAFEAVAPVRSFPSYRGQRHYPGLWWSSTTGKHVGFESWLERDEAMLLDFDPQVLGFASQPFCLHWNDGDQARSHVPDYFARVAEGTGVVIDCRPRGRANPRSTAASRMTERACAEAGWRYRLVGEHDPVVCSNVRWLAGYRHPRHHQPAVAQALLQVFEEPLGLLDGAASIGEPIAVLPVCYYLLWQQALRVDLTVPLGEGTRVWCTTRRQA